MGSVVALRQEQPRRVGRPTLYSPELTAKLVTRLSAGMSLRAVCRAKDMPHIQVVLNWRARYPEFAEQYARALEARGCAYGEQVVDIGQRVIAGEILPERGRVAIDALKWAAGRMAPKVFGDRVEVSGAVKHEHTHLLLARATDEQLDVLEATVAQIDGIAIAGPDSSREGEEGGGEGEG